VVIAAQILIAVILHYSIDFWANSLCPHDSVSIHLKYFLTWLPWGYVGAGCVMVYQSTLNAKDKVIDASILGVSHRLALLLPLAWLGFNDGHYSLYPALTLAHLLAGITVMYIYMKNRAKSVNKLARQEQTVI